MLPTDWKFTSEQGPWAVLELFPSCSFPACWMHPLPTFASLCSPALRLHCCGSKPPFPCLRHSSPLPHPSLSPPLAPQQMIHFMMILNNGTHLWL